MISRGVSVSGGALRMRGVQLYNGSMIASLSGELVEVGEDRVELSAGALVFELLVPAADIEALRGSMGQELTFHTIFYLQGDTTGGSLTPRLIGFLRAEDKRFFEKFTSVKGIGPKTALRALTAPVGDIAQAIESRDARYLSGLKGIGKRTAELIIAELAGKVEEFSTAAVAARFAPRTARSEAEEDAIATLITLGERRTDAEHLLERARQQKPEAKTTAELVKEMLRLRMGRG